MKPWPRSLWGRTALLVAVIVLLTEAMTLALLAHTRMHVIRQQGLELAGAYLVMGRSALAVMPPEQLARELLEQSSRHFGGQGQPAMRLRHRPPMQPADARTASIGVTLLYNHLRGEWGDDRVAVSMPPESDLLIRLQDDWWLQLLTVPNDDLSLLTGSIPWLLLVVAVLSALIGWFVLHLARPLLTLEKTVAAFARGGEPPSAPPSGGPLEVHRLAARIHDMMHDLREHERERRTMLAGLPHDIRAPLTRLRLRLALLGDSGTAAMEQDIRAIEHIAEQFIGYLRGLDHEALQPELFSLSEMAAQVAEGYSQTGRPVQLALGPAPVYVRADALMMRRLLENLLQNAFHHGAQPVRLGLETEGEAVRLVVEDGGRGIPADRREQAQRPFTQLAGGRGSQGQVGLGLAVVRQILLAHGLSAVLADSELGGLKVVIDLGPVLGRI